MCLGYIMNFRKSGLSVSIADWWNIQFSAVGPSWDVRYSLLFNVRCGIFSFIHREMWDILFYSSWDVGYSLLFIARCGIFSFIHREMWDILFYSSWDVGHSLLFILRCGVFFYIHRGMILSLYVHRHIFLLEFLDHTYYCNMYLS